MLSRMLGGNRVDRPRIKRALIVMALATGILAVGCRGEGAAAPPAAPAGGPSPTGSIPAPAGTPTPSVSPTAEAGDDDLKGLPSWVPPREEVDPEVWPVYDDYIEALTLVNETEAKQKAHVAEYRRLVKDAKLVAKQYRQGKVPYGATIKATRKQQAAWDKQFDDADDLQRYQFRLDLAEERLASALQEST